MPIPLYVDFRSTTVSASPIEILGDIFVVNPELAGIAGGGFDVYIGPLDPPNNTFPTLEEGQEYKALQLSSTFIDAAELIYGVGSYYYAGPIRNSVQNFDTVNNKQNYSDNLEQFAGITGPISSDMIDLLGESSWSTLKSSMELSNVDNTSDASKPVSTATQAALNAKFDTPAGTTAQYVRGDGTLATFPTIPSALSPTANNNVSRSLNSNYTISSNVRGAIVNYSINAAWTLSELLSGSGTAFLEYSTDSGSTWITVNNVGKTLNLLTFAGSDDMNLSGFVPSTATTTRIRTTSSNMTVTYTRGQEVLL